MGIGFVIMLIQATLGFLMIMKGANLIRECMVGRGWILLCLGFVLAFLAPVVGATIDLGHLPGAIKFWG